MANLITCLRIICAIALLFCPAFSPLFYCLYLIAGFSDMIDGTVARMTGNASDFGARLDTCADFAFVAACLIRLISALEIPLWILIWTLLIALLKILNAFLGFVWSHGLLADHSVLNKITGALLFAFPLTVSFVDIGFSASVVCLFASIAAVSEFLHVLRLRKRG